MWRWRSWQKLLGESNAPLAFSLASPASLTAAGGAFSSSGYSLASTSAASSSSSSWRFLRARSPSRSKPRSSIVSFWLVGPPVNHSGVSSSWWYRRRPEQHSTQVRMLLDKHAILSRTQSSITSQVNQVKWHHYNLTPLHAMLSWPQSSSITMASSHRASPWPQSSSITCQVNHARWTLLQSAATARYAFMDSVIKYHHGLSHQVPPWTQSSSITKYQNFLK